MAIYKHSIGDQKKERKCWLYLINRGQLGSRHIFFAVLWNQYYGQHLGGGQSIFFTQWFYILSVFNMERYLACPAFLAVFINQDNQYQQNKQKINIMIKHKRYVKEYFQRYSTNEKHKTIIFFQSDLYAHAESFQIGFILIILKDHEDIFIFCLWALRVTCILKSSFTLFEVCKNKIDLLSANAEIS